MRMKPNRERNRIDGERALHAINIVIQRGYRIWNHGRLLDETGYQIRTHEGPVINLYDTGSITVSGNNRDRFGEVEALRMPDTCGGVLVVASNDDEVSSDLSLKLRGWGIAVESAFFGQDIWMDALARAIKRGCHVIALVSKGISRDSRMARSHADPNVYFGLGMLAARSAHEHTSIICTSAIEMPSLDRLNGMKSSDIRDTLMKSTTCCDYAWVYSLINS